MLNQVFLDALNQMMADYTFGRFRPLSESDVQAYLYARCILALHDKVSVLPIHTERRLVPAPPGLSRSRVDLTLGDEVAVELKFEPVYEGVRTPVAESREAIQDMVRLRQLHGFGFAHCHFLFIDEHGMHARNRNGLYEDIEAKWLPIRTPRGPAYFLHWTADS